MCESEGAAGFLCVHMEEKVDELEMAMKAHDSAQEASLLRLQQQLEQGDEEGELARMALRELHRACVSN